MARDDLAHAKLLLEVVPRVMRYIRTEMRALARSELTVPQFRVLVRLAKGPSTNRELADSIGVSAPTMCRMVATLNKRGLVSAKAGLRDGRQIALTLTDKGRTRFESIRGRVQEKFSLRISNLPEDRKAAMSRGLAVLGELFEDGPAGG